MYALQSSAVEMWLFCLHFLSSVVTVSVHGVQYHPSAVNSIDRGNRWENHSDFFGEILAAASAATAIHLLHGRYGVRHTYECTTGVGRYVQTPTSPPRPTNDADQEGASTSTDEDDVCCWRRTNHSQSLERSLARTLLVACRTSTRSFARWMDACEIVS